MRAKRSKKYRKLMQQYELTFGFREPYQVLVDSNFLRAVYSFKMDLVPALERTLHGKVKPFITKCSLAAVMASSSTQQQQQSKFVPNTRPPQLPPPTTLPLRYCSHNEDSKTIDEVDCLLSLLSPNPELKKNKEHYILATADPEPTNTHTQKWKSIAATAPEPPTNYLRKGARQIPGVPIIYVKRSVMVLEPLSNSSEGVREGVERGKLKTGITKTMAGKRKRDDADEGEGKDTSTGTKEKKPKRAKGPNPLSVKKPKNHAKPSNSSRGGGGGGGGGVIGGGGEKNENNKPAEAERQPAHGSEDENVKDKSNAGGEPTGKTKRKRRHKSHKSDNSQEAGLPQLGAPLAVEL
ncbi:rRNA processing protein [Histoplasma capsulatum G186AR]|uniref:rRNA processing protein n=1 Tax=Ajellomyces capsulatus TaxID=5037 RepID=A0A8H7Z2F4_AJECA|nr:rRNA processing protein [Histoplasma capsulatum]QSS71605.1 rRNA processing protein [Histoplasma capsulatum G186AR]